MADIHAQRLSEAQESEMSEPFVRLVSTLLICGLIYCEGAPAPERSLEVAQEKQIYDMDSSTTVKSKATEGPAVLFFHVLVLCSILQPLGHICVLS